MYFSISFRFGNRENRLFHISPSLAAIERPSISSMDGGSNMIYRQTSVVVSRGRNMIYRPTSVVGSIVST